MKRASWLPINQIVQGGREEQRWMLLPRRPALSQQRYGYGPSLLATCTKDWETSPRDVSVAMGPRAGVFLS